MRILKLIIFKKLILIKIYIMKFFFKFNIIILYKLKLIISNNRDLFINNIIIFI